LGLLVMSQLPILVAPPLLPPAVAVEDELDDPQAATREAAARALTIPRERVKRMRGSPSE
jgi:hypothetical protein